jgi:hypothetical protein
MKPSRVQKDHRQLFGSRARHRAGQPYRSEAVAKRLAGHPQRSSRQAAVRASGQNKGDEPKKPASQQTPTEMLVHCP